MIANQQITITEVWFDMDLVHTVSKLAEFGFVISIPAALAIWNRIAKSGHWPTSKAARQDGEFWNIFIREAQKEAGAGDAGQNSSSS